MSTSTFKATLRRLNESKADDIRALLREGKLNKNQIAKQAGANYTQVHDIARKMIEKGELEPASVPMGKTAAAILNGTASTPPTTRAAADPTAPKDKDGKSAKARELWNTTDLSIAQIAKAVGMHYSHAWQTLKNTPRTGASSTTASTPEPIEGEVVPGKAPDRASHAAAAQDVDFDDIVPAGSVSYRREPAQLGNGAIRNPGSRLGAGSSSDNQIPLKNGPDPRQLGYSGPPTRTSPSSDSSDSQFPLGNGADEIPDIQDGPEEKDPMVAATTGRNSPLNDRINDKILDLVSVVDDPSVGMIVQGVIDGLDGGLVDNISSRDLETMVRVAINRLVKSKDLELTDGSLKIPTFDDDFDGPSADDLAGEDDYDQNISDLEKAAAAGGREGSAYDSPDEDRFGDDDDDENDDNYGSSRRNRDDSWMDEWMPKPSSRGRRDNYDD